MNRILALALPLAAMALLAACGRNDAEDAAAAEVQVADPGTPDAPADSADRPLTLDLGDGNVNIAVIFPASVAAQPALYDTLRAQAEAEAAEAREIAADDRAARADGDFPFNAHELEINWEPRFENGAVLSLLKQTYVFQGGAHPNAYYDAMTWDKAAQAPIAVTDLFTGPAWAALSPAAEQALMAEKRARLGEGLSDEQYWTQDVIYATAPAAENFALFTLVPSAGDPERAGGVALYYAPYAVGPYAEGAYTAVIPQSVFAAHVQPAYAGLFGGEPASN